MSGPQVEGGSEGISPGPILKAVDKVCKACNLKGHTRRSSKNCKMSTNKDSQFYIGKSNHEPLSVDLCNSAGRGGSIVTKIMYIPTEREFATTTPVDIDSEGDRNKPIMDSNFIVWNDGARLELIPFDDDEEVCYDKIEESDRPQR